MNAPDKLKNDSGEEAADATSNESPGALEGKTPEASPVPLDSMSWSEFVKRYHASYAHLQAEDQVPPNAAPHCVTIFGGGIAGLTAAHELVERGFRVQVWDPVFDDRDPSRGCDVGGLARTQWTRVPWHEGMDASARATIPREWNARRTEPIRHLPWVFYTSGDAKPAIIGAVGECSAYFRDGASTTADDEGICAIVREMAMAVMSEPVPYGRRIYCEVQRLYPSTAQGFIRAQAVVGALNEFIGGIANVKVLKEESSPYTELYVARATSVQNPGLMIDFHITLLDEFPEGLPAGVCERISYRVRERWIAGEHGFRFFPAFYRHLFDTMKRIPILEPTNKSMIGAAQERAVTVDPNPDKYVETGRTVFDNLRATTKQIIALPHSLGPTVLSRSLPKSFEELREWSRLVLDSAPALDGNEPATKKGGFGFTLRDVALFQLKFLQYVTSCDARREEYENMSWIEYLGGESAYSAEFVRILNSIPQALVAMDAMVSDARTQGSVFAQLLLDNLKPDGYRDGTLVGPTSVAWFTPWRRYLEAQGVEFIHGKITGFEAVHSPVTESARPVKLVWPEVECYEPRYPGALERRHALMPGYFVLALPAGEMQAIAAKFVEASRDIVSHRDMRRAAAFIKTKEDREPLKKPSPTGSLRHMIGIQYYFDEDIYWRDGHFYLPVSKWGISAISQVRFWQDKHDWEHGYRGVLSVVFTTLEHREGNTIETLWNRKPEEIAEEIWKQIQHSIGDQHLPVPRYWHIDFGFQPNYETKGGRVIGYENETPMLINIPGKWEKRPGELSVILDEDIKPGEKFSEYVVEQGIVLAGTVMKTHTRLTTMEAANESGRHAVNAILQDAQARSRKIAERLKTQLSGQTGGASSSSQVAEPVDEHQYTPCDIWPLELHEVDDFKFLKEVDAELHGRRLDHFIEILDLAELFRTGLRGTRKNVRDPFDPLAVLSQLDRVLESLHGGIVSAIRKHEVER